MSTGKQLDLTKPEILYFVSDKALEAICNFEHELTVRNITKRTSSNYHLINIEGNISRDVCSEIENAYRSVGWSEAVCKEGFTPNTTVLQLYHRL